MNKPTSTNTQLTKSITSIVSAALLLFSANSLATVTLEKEIKVTDSALYFDGVKKSVTQSRAEPYIEGQKMNYAYGNAIVPHGDAVKAYKHYVFMTWYRGGILDRHVMLTRYNTLTDQSVTIEFPHQHTGFEGRWWVGETHNTIAVAISPKDETIHLLYDMHAYSPGKDTGGNGSFRHDYFRYSYSVEGAAAVADNQFTLAQFVKDTSATNEGDNDYKHVTMTGMENVGAFSRLSYPRFFLNDQGDLLMHMRQGTSHDGRVVFNKYNSTAKKWDNFKSFNVLGAGSQGDVKDWSIYGVMKYQDGKIRLGFQRRLNQPNKFRANEGMYYAYSDDPSGATLWKNYKDEDITIPVIKPDNLLVLDQSTLMPEVTGRNQVSITGGFDWTVTDKGDVHMIGRVGEYVGGRTIRNIYSHSYQKDGVGEFVTTTDFPGAEEIYAAGDNIYIIGLENKRPFIEQALGGTNDFTRVYTAPADSKTFQKGVVYINNGKVYYYLLGFGSGDKRTTYLQIIDLGLNDNEIPEDFTYAANEGSTVEVVGTMDIAFGVNGQFNYIYGATENISCHRNVFGDPVPGVAKKCYVKSVVDSTPTVAFEQGEVTLEEGYQQLTLSVLVESPSDLEIDNVKLYLNGDFVRQESLPPYEWGHAGLPNELLGLTPGRYSYKAVATDINGNEGIKYKIINVNEAANSNPTGCDSVTDIAWNNKTEVTLTASNSCIRFEQTLTGATLQFFDSDTNTSCDFNGNATSVDGSGSINISSTYKQSSDFTGTTIKLTPSNSCTFIKVRAY